jgi:SAM-dependent methyltransferase
MTMLRIAHAPSKIKWLASRAMHHVPMIKSFVEKRETAQLVEIARKSAERVQDFSILHSGWARKTMPFETEKVLSELAKIDVANGSYILPGVIQSKHFSRIYEYPYAAFHLSDVRKDGRVLDCGCGTTSFQFYLAEQGFDVYGVDDWLPCLEKVASLKKTLGLANLTPTFGSIFKLPFEDNYFDGASCISVLEHALAASPENSKLLLKGGFNELLRVMKKGAPIVLTFDVNYGPEKRNLTPNEYNDLCEILSIESSTLPEDRLYSSDTKEGLEMGKDLAIFSVTLTKT